MIEAFLSISFIFMMKVNMLVWNCRGTGKQHFARSVNDLPHKHHFSILVLLETRVSGVKADKIASKFGFDGAFRVHPNGFAGGIWVFWDKNIWQSDILFYN